ncbi:histone-lysine N-methyltransferase SETMAR-like [Harpegnathos saltator]|uniref:histone-lysine N-methyltransferase SETMAR-like n=1 Tax=Harpegnathos saltator TaxID=610380 RepID=UPI000DBEEA33|nr:histone-lysine N-methyltransferase SETMAR-like [Harpegnathos saltator]
MIEVDWHVSGRSIAQELKINHKTVLNPLTKQNEIEPFLKQMVTGDEKWITYDNIVRKRSWSKRSETAQTVAKPGLTVRKLAIFQKRPELVNRRGIVFHQDNARPHTSIVTRQKLRELGWEVSMHRPSSQDLALSDYHLFLSLQNFLDGKKLTSREDCENRLVEFFANKDQGFYERGIMKLLLK